MEKRELLSNEYDGHLFTLRQEWFVIRVVAIGAAVYYISLFFHH